MLSVKVILENGSQIRYGDQKYRESRSQIWNWREGKLKIVPESPDQIRYRHANDIAEVVANGGIPAENASVGTRETS
ncbi:MAG: hypothetical protein IPI90_15730 [Saprospiraceae bacterium]|nr:hypothetical protein [Candidatus Vicinibacter affinis]